MAIKQKHNVIRIKNPSSGEWEPILALKDSDINPLKIGAMPLIEDANGTLYKLAIDENGIYAIDIKSGNQISNLQLINENSIVYADADGKIRLAMKKEVEDLAAVVEELQTKITQLDEDVNTTVSSAVEELSKI